MDQDEKRQYLIRTLLAERGEAESVALPPDEAGQRTLLRALMNVRPAGEIGAEFLRVQDEYLHEATDRKTIAERSICMDADIAQVIETLK